MHLQLFIYLYLYVEAKIIKTKKTREIRTINGQFIIFCKYCILKERKIVLQPDSNPEFIVLHFTVLMIQLCIQLLDYSLKKWIPKALEFLLRARKTTNLTNYSRYHNYFCFIVLNSRFFLNFEWFLESNWEKNPVKLSNLTPRYMVILKGIQFLKSQFYYS